MSCHTTNLANYLVSVQNRLLIISFSSGSHSQVSLELCMTASCGCSVASNRAVSLSFLFLYCVYSTRYFSHFVIASITEMFDSIATVSDIDSLTIVFKSFKY